MTETVVTSSLAAASVFLALTRVRSFLIWVLSVALRALFTARRRSFLRMFLIALLVLAKSFSLSR